MYLRETDSCGPETFRWLSTFIRQVKGRRAGTGHRRDRLVKTRAIQILTVAGLSGYLLWGAGAPASLRDAAPLRPHHAGLPWVGPGPHVAVRLKSPRLALAVYPPPRPGSLLLNVPLMPGARLSRTPMPMPYALLFGPYAKWGKTSVYVVPRPLLTVERVTSARLSALGYFLRAWSSETVHGPSTPPALTRTFTLPDSGGPLTITVSFQARGPDRTAVQYVVKTLDLPARPKRTLIQWPVRSLTLYVLPEGSSRPHVVSIKSRRYRLTIIRALNGLPVYGNAYAGALSCGLASLTLSMRIESSSGAIYQLGGGACGGFQLKHIGGHGFSIDLGASTTLTDVLERTGIPGL